MLRFALAALLTIGQTLASSTACAADTHADAHSETAADRRAAAKLFAEGQRAYRSGDYRHAAASFEEAYKRAPRLPPLWNAARAWQKGGELVRAANLYASYLRKAPPRAPDRNSATSALRELSTKVAELEIHATGMTDLKLDGAPLDLGDQDVSSLVLYVTPGSHVIEGDHEGKPARQTATGVAGASTSVVLLPPVEAPPPPPPPVVVEKPHHGWSPIVVAVAGGATAVAAGFLLWSGLDTVSQRSTFDQNPTQANLDTGKSDEARTNVLLGVTLGLGVFTGVVALFLTDWKGHPTEHAARAPWIRVGLGGATVGGSF
jgi:hypothetical protein